MKLHIFLVLTHVVVAAILASVIAGAAYSGDLRVIAAGFGIAVLTVGAAALFATRRLKRGLEALDTLVSNYQHSEKFQTGIAEFDQLALRFAKCAVHWESVAAATRDQAGELQAMVSLLDRRGMDRRGLGEPSSQQLRGALTSLGRGMSTHLLQIERGAAEINQFSKSITEGAESQGHAVVKTTTYVEQLSTTIDTVSSNASSAKSVLQRAGKSATTGLQLMGELNQGLKRVQAETQSCEKRLKGLCDPARQISATVDTISDIAARTNLLALNASIESIRAGEHGRGFALVADEVRNLAEQAADATREISSLMDSIQLATQESILGISREREQVEAEVQRAARAETTLRQITELGKETRAIELIAESSAQQLQLAQDVVLAVEQISSLAKANRGNAESVGWTMKTLTNVSPELGKIIERLRNGSGEETSQAALVSNPVIMTSSATAADLAPVG